MPEILKDQIIRDFLFDYSRYKKLRNVYEDAQVVMDKRIPIYIARFRQLAHRMTQAQLANALGVSHTYISKIENGRETPSPEFMDKFAKFIHLWGENETK